MFETIKELAPLIIALVFSMTVHEVAHGWTAGLFGDPTAREQGRITLNPIKHIDPVFTLLVPAVLYITTGVAFGGAKPVPFDPSRFRQGTHVQRAIMWVAAAGPISNFILALLAAFGMGLIHLSAGEGVTGGFTYRLLDQFLICNIVIGIFNLLPIPPLDGAKVLAGVLPMFLARQLYALERFSLIFIILIFLLPVGPIIIEPIKWLHQQYMTLVTFTLSPFL